MTRRDSNTLIDAVKIVEEFGFDGLEKAVAMLLNEAMKAERNRTLGAGNYERTENRKEKMYLYFLRRKSRSPSVK